MRHTIRNFLLALGLLSILLTAGAYAWPQGPVDEATPLEEDPCWTTLPSGIKIATCFAIPEEPPVPPTPSPEPTEPPQDDDGNPPPANPANDNNPPQNPNAADPTVDLPEGGGGCQLGGGLAAGSMLGYLGVKLILIGLWVRSRQPRG